MTLRGGARRCTQHRCSGCSLSLHRRRCVCACVSSPSLRLSSPLVSSCLLPLVSVSLPAPPVSVVRLLLLRLLLPLLLLPPPLVEHFPLPLLLLLFPLFSRSAEFLSNMSHEIRTPSDRTPTPTPTSAPTRGRVHTAPHRGTAVTAAVDMCADRATHSPSMPMLLLVSSLLFPGALLVSPPLSMNAVLGLVSHTCDAAPPSADRRCRPAHAPQRARESDDDVGALLAWCALAPSPCPVGFHLLVPLSLLLPFPFLVPLPLPFAFPPFLALSLSSASVVCWPTRR